MRTFVPMSEALITVRRMGRIIYSDNKSSVEVDDRLLAHLQIVVMNKLRRGESFMMTFPHTASGHVCWWLAPAVPVMFHFYGTHTPRLSRDLVDRLMAEASSPDGVHVAAEYDELLHMPDARNPRATETSAR